MSSILVAVTTRAHWLSGPVGRIRIFSPASELTIASAWWESRGPSGREMLACSWRPRNSLTTADRAVLQLRDVPNVRAALSIALSCLPWAGEGPLSILVNDLAILNNHVDCPQVHFIVVGDHVGERGVCLVLQPLPLTGGLRNLGQSGD